MFRTPTGQTGKDAYVYELAAIANEKRELDKRFLRLLTIMKTELPESAEYDMSIATEEFPEAFLTADKDTIVRQLSMYEQADRFSIEWVQEMLATLRP